MAWFCLWTEMLDCAKLAELDDNTFRGWIMLLACAKRHDLHGTLPKLKELAYWCRTQEAIVRTWLLVLVEHELIERDGDVFKIHDWHHWQNRKPGPIAGASGAAKSNAERQRDWRQKHKEERLAARNVTAPPPLDSPITDNTVTVQYSGITLRNENHSVTNNVTPFVTDYVTGSHTHTSFVFDCEECKKGACIELAVQRWGASNGDAVISDLLRDFSPDIVMESMDAVFNKFAGRLEVAYLRKTCQNKHQDHARKNGRK